MRKLLILFTLLNCTFFSSPAQTNSADSLKQLLAAEKQDTSRILVMNQLARMYSFSKPDTALVIAGQALELSRKINFKKGEISALRNTGFLFMNAGNYPRSLEVLLQALKIAEETNDDEDVGSVLGSLGDVYIFQGDIKRSLDYSYRAIAIQQRRHDSARLAVVMLNMGDNYEKLNQLDSALVYTRLAYQIAVSGNYVEIKAITLNNLGNIFLKSGRLDTAMTCYKSAIVLLNQVNNNGASTETSLGMAKIFLQKKQTDSCLYYAKLSLGIARNTGFIEQLLAASNFLAEYYRSAGNVDSAYAYQSAAIAAKDSMYSQQKMNQMQALTYDESMRKQQVEEAKEQERTRAKQNALIGGLAALLIVAFLLYRNNRQKRKANSLLQQQKEEIDHKAKELSIQKENLQQSYNNVEQLGEIGRKITSSLSVEKIIGTVYDNVNALMDANVFGIGIYNDDLKRIEFPATYEDGQALALYANSIEDKNRFGVICFNEGKEIIIGNLDEEYKLYLQEVQAPHEGKQPISLIFLPLVVKEKKLGVITVQSFDRNAYSDYHLFMLRNIAVYTAIAIENAESYETLNQTVVTLKSTQAQLIQSEKMASLGELTAGIAHEIQNPLNFVNNFSELNEELIEELKKERSKLHNERDEKAEGEILNDINRNNEKILFHGKRADTIVKGMLQHSRTGSGQTELTNINALADEYLRLAYHGLRAKDKSFNAEIKTDFDVSIGKMNIIPQDIGKVLLNLFNNAFYAVNEKKKTNAEKYQPTITVQTKKINDKVEIKVTDNGTGISQNIADKIFQPFFTTKPTGQGTGLGLSLSYDIIKAHGGEIKVKTLSAEAAAQAGKEGEGSEFILWLPI